MIGSADPGWIRAALAVYDACLWLYPKPLRDAHGDEMRQAFRDRCREVVRGEQSAFRVLFGELLPDTLRSAGSEQLSATFGEMRPRQYWALGLLCCALLGLLFRDSLSRHTLDIAFKAKYALQEMRYAREQSQHEDRVRDLATSLVAAGTLEAKAEAAYLYRSVYLGRMNQWQLSQQDFSSLLVADGERATALAADVFGAHASGHALAVATQACETRAGCNRDAAIRQLTSREPDNAYGWSLAFTSAAQRNDESGMRDAVQKMAQSSHFENYQGRITSDLLQAAQAIAPDDIDYLESIAAQVRASGFAMIRDFREDIRSSCMRRPAEDSSDKPRWLELHPEMQEACLRIALLLSNSTDLRTARWGAQRIFEAETDPAKLAVARQRLRDRWWWQQRGWAVGRNGHINDHGWDEWTLAEWQVWVSAWTPGDGEIPSVKRWLKSRGMPVSAPPDYETPPM